MKVIDGVAIAARLTASVKADVRALASEQGIVPGLAVVLVGEDPVSAIYVRRKLERTRFVGMSSFEHRLPPSTTEAALLDLIARLNLDPDVHGILVQLPLPSHIGAARVLDAIRPDKDVDGFHPVNVGRLSTSGGGPVPCTPLGCLMLLDTVIDDFRGLRAVVIGKSNIVGKPAALLLLDRECTVTVAHVLTRDLPSISAAAEILLSPPAARGWSAATGSSRERW